MADIRPGNLRISGRLKIGNAATGSVNITPVANTPTSATVSGLALAGAGTIVGLCTGAHAVPGSEVQETSVSSVSASGMTVWVYRSNTTVTQIDWLMWRNRV